MWSLEEQRGRNILTFNCKIKGFVNGFWQLWGKRCISCLWLKKDFTTFCWTLEKQSEPVSVKNKHFQRTIQPLQSVLQLHIEAIYWSNSQFFALISHLDSECCPSLKTAFFKGLWERTSLIKIPVSLWHLYVALDSNPCVLCSSMFQTHSYFCLLKQNACQPVAFKKI